MSMTKQMIVDQNTHWIKSGQSVALNFSLDMDEAQMEDSSFRLQLRGRAGIHPSWMYEGGLPYLFRDIDDALCTETDHSRFSLRIRCRGEDYPRRAYYRIDCPPRINSQYPVPPNGSTEWAFSGTVRTEDLEVEEHGSAQIRFETWMKWEGRDIRDIGREPDRTDIVNLPRGTSGWTRIGGQIEIGPDTAAVLVTIEVEKASGTVWLEDFSLTNDKGFNILPPFDMTNRYHEFMNWMGENLSQKEWTDLLVTVNGCDLGVHSCFQRCFAGNENEISVPDGVLRPGRNELILKNVSDYFQPVPYVLSRLAVHAEKTRPAQIIYCPEYVRAGEEFGILIRTGQPDLEVCVETDEPLSVKNCTSLRGKGLHVVRLSAGKAGEHLEVTVSCRSGGDRRAVAAGPADGSGEKGQKAYESYRDSAWIKRIVEKETDGVITGSGDAVYIAQDMDEMERYLCWYLSENLGNMITFRPVYRWSGSRSCHPDVWRRMAELCSGLNMGYCYITDGRELPGINANPSDAMLQGDYYLGSQGHERDGAFYYWLQTHRMCNETLYEQICRKVCRHPDYTYRVPFEYGTDDVYYNFNPVKCADMEEGARQFVEKAAASLKGIKRHTGPSTLFKYLYQAGIEVCGAELMYGPTEVILSALRGASEAWNKERFAAHLAVQWGTTPHDTETHFRRFRLALYLSYMHGCHHINTEEGFYRMEEMFAESDRFSISCSGHADIQREFLTFIQTHSRRGRMVSPAALLHGADDAWVCFTRRNAWSQEGDAWQFDTPEESWDLLRVFYPDSVLDAIYRHPCPDEPQGYYTRTPYGTVDILPAEAAVEKYMRHSHLAFLGYNTAAEDQIEKLEEYVKNGGKLLLGWCHLLTDTDRETAIRGIPHPLDARRLTGLCLRSFRQGADGGRYGDVEQMAEHMEVLETREGVPFVIRRKLGKGQVYFVNAAEYPADQRVRDTYENLLRQFAEEAARENFHKGWMTGNDTVGTAVYDREDGQRVIYAVNTDWWSSPVRCAKGVLHLADREYEVDIPADRITQITINGETAAVVSDLETEVMEIRQTEKGCAVTVQGSSEARMTIYSSQGVSELTEENGTPLTGRKIPGEENGDESGYEVLLHPCGRRQITWKRKE